MSLTNTNNRMDYTGTGATATYSYTFKIFDKADLRVVKRVIATGVETLLAVDTDYTVSGVKSESGGTITLLAGNLPSTHTLTIRRVRSLTQETDIRNQGDYYPETIEDTFDELVMIDQQQQEELDRSMKLPETLSASTFDATLPFDINQASRVLVTNDTADGFETGPELADITAASANALAAAASAAAALASQGAAATSAATASTAAVDSAASGTNAATSAAAAASSATTASTQAGNASTSATAAAGSATAAAGSATSASGSASTATTQASNASTSATNAANSATAAATSATNAGNSATAAATSATNAANSATAAAAVIPAQSGATAGLYLKSNGTSASWASAAVNLAIQTKATNYALLTTDDGADCSGNMTLTIPTAVGNAGKVFYIKKTDAIGTVVTLATTSSQTIDGTNPGTTARNLYTQNESLIIRSDNANWQVVEHRTNTDWVAATPTYSTGAVGSVSPHNFFWRRQGDTMQLRYELKQTSTGTGGSGSYSITIPVSMSVDTNKATTGTNYIAQNLGAASMFDGTTTYRWGAVYAFDSTHIRIVDQAGNDWSSSNFSFANNGLRVGFSCAIPIANWWG